MTASPESGGPTVDARIHRILEAYLADLSRGAAPDRDALLAEHADIAEPLGAALRAAEFVHVAGHSVAAESAPRGDGAPSDAGQALGDFRILKEIGRGGMAVVYEAEQVSLGRRVALKVLPFAAVLDPRQLQRFRNEAHAAALLHHAHIVPVYGVGCDRGVHYLSMQLIEGQSLAEAIRVLRGAEERASTSVTPVTGSSPRERRFFQMAARLGAQAAEALEHAHRLGIVHRDVKPANLLVDARGHLWVVDFGLARFHADATLTMTGDLLGTVRYMSPEQARAQPVLDHRTDVYSLGVTLYELVTLTPAFPGDDPRQVIQDVTTKSPPAPRSINPALPTDLETILLKAMDKDPARRYATAQDLADDLGRFTDNRPVLARRIGPVERLARWCRRNPVVAALSISVFVALAGAAVVATVLAASLRVERDAAREGRDRAQRAEKEKTERLYESCVAQARAARHSGRPGRRFDCLDAVRAAAAIHRDRALRDEAVASLALCDLRVEATWENGPSGAARPTFDPDLTRVIRSRSDGTRVVADVATGRDLARFRDIGADRWNGDVSPDGRFLFVGGEDRDEAGRVTGAHVVEVWQFDGPARRLTDRGAVCAAFSPDSRTVALPQHDGSVALRDLASGAEVGCWKGAHEFPYAAAFHPDGHHVAVSSRNATCVDVVSADRVVSIALPDHATGIAWSPTGDLLAVACSDMRVHLWEWRDPPVERFALQHARPCLDAVFGNGGATLATFAWDGCFRLWDPESGELLIASSEAAFGVWAARDGSRAALWGDGTREGVWRLADDRPSRLLVSRSGVAGNSQCNACAFMFDDRVLVTASSDGVRLFGVVERRQLAWVPLEAASTVALSDGGECVLVGTPDSLWRLPIRWDTSSPTRTRLLVGRPSKVGGLADGTGHGAVALPNTARAAVVDGAEVALLDLEGAGRVVHRIGPHAAEFISVATSADGARIATTPWGGYGVRVWDTASGQLVTELQFKGPSSASFSPDGRRIIAGNTWEYCIWDTATWKELHRLPRKHCELWGPSAFTADSLAVIVELTPTTAAVLDTETFELLTTLEGPELLVVPRLATSASGALVAVPLSNDRVRIWDLRAVRQELAKLDLDWDHPPIPAAPDAPQARLEIELVK